ncbi:MAG: tandem-95 repeat protein, partial [Cyclobacteriaceae bacterium]
TVVGTLTTTDPDVGDTHTYSLVPGNGSNDNSRFEIVGNQLRTLEVFNFEDDNTLNIRIQTEDAAGETFSEAFVISVTNVNDPPVAADDLNNSTTESNPVTVDVVANDTDEDGTVIPGSVSIATNAANGNAVHNGDGTVTYTPNAGFTGGDSFTYTVDDNQGATSNQASVVVTVGPNNPPVANDDLNNTVDEDDSIDINVIGNDTDSDGSIDPTSINIVTDPTFGTAVANNDGTVTYTPNPDSNDNDSFTYEVNDNLGATSNVAQVTISVNPINDPPVANNDAETIAEDDPVNIDVLFNDLDIDGTLNTSSVSIVSGPSNGSVVVNSNGTVDYTPDPGYNGSDSFTYTVRDNQNALSNVATVSITITSVNDPPTANNDPNNPTSEEVAVTIDVVANDVDSDGTINPNTVNIVAPPANGTAVNNGDGTVTYTPNLNFNGTNSFTYTVQDNDGAVSNIATVTIQVNSVNDLPIAVDDLNNTTNEDVALVIDLTSNDIDSDGFIVNSSITIVNNPSNGAVAVFNNGSIRYDPSADFNGEDSLRYTVEDNQGGVSNSALVAITINDINDPPVAVNDAATTEEDTSVTIDVLSNDTDIDGSLVPSTVSIFSNPGKGTVVIDPSGTITYTPFINEVGGDNFTYVVEDDDGAISNVGRVDITINDNNDPPIANDDAANTDEDQAVTINVTNNDTDVDGSINDASIVIETNPSNGSVVVNNDGTVEYTPNLNFNGLDTFNYTVEDDDGALSNIAQVSVSVNNVNDALSANDDDVVTDEDVQILINVIANDVDSDGSIDPTTVNVVTSPVNGTIEVNQDGTVLYKPIQDYFGSDLFTYNVRDDEGQVSNIATVSITINDINDLPIAQDDNLVVDEDLQTTLNIIDNDSDVDGSIAVTGVTLISSPVNGQIDLSGEGVKYTPNENYTGDDVFIYTVTDDDDGVSNEATVFLTIRDINDAPSDLILSNTFIHESEPIGTSVGAFTTVDIDPDETFTYSLVVGDGDDDNNAFIIEGDELVTQINFIQSQQDDYLIRVKTDDGES